MIQIAINACFGGFSLSDKAVKELSKRLGFEVDAYLYVYDPNIGIDKISRANPFLVDVVKELGEDANGPCARLRIIEIPDGVDWEISEYDGNEHVAERHRTWY